MPRTPQARNDALADSLDLARRRISKQEDARNAAELKLEYTEVSGVLQAQGACWAGTWELCRGVQAGGVLRVTCSNEGWPASICVHVYAVQAGGLCEGRGTLPVIEGCHVRVCVCVCTQTRCRCFQDAARICVCEGRGSTVPAV